MKVGEYEIPDELLYTKEHEWIRLEGGRAVVGITDYAAKALHDVVYVSLPQVGIVVSQMGLLGTVESIKAVSEIYSPVAGRVLRINGELASRPELVNQLPYSEGWLVEIEPSNIGADRPRLLSARDYGAHVHSLMKQ